MAAIVRNFLFHRVSNEADAMWPPMKPELFEHIIATLTKNYKVVPLEHYLDDKAAFASEKKIATVLFDDGYKDNIEIAAPILSKYKCPASFYVVTDCIDQNIPTWTYILDDRFSKTRKEKIELDFDFVPEKYKVVTLGNSNTNKKEIKPWLKKLSNTQRQLVLECILQQCNDAALPQNKMMNWKEVKQLTDNGFIIGSHSHTHPMLASLQNENEIADELKISRNKIYSALGFYPASISYPIGSFDERVTKLAKETGYKYGLAVKQQFFKYGQNDLYEIPRVELYQEPWWKVQMRMKGIYSALKKITG